MFQVITMEPHCPVAALADDPVQAWAAARRLGIADRALVVPAPGRASDVIEAHEKVAQAKREAADALRRAREAEEAESEAESAAEEAEHRLSSAEGTIDETRDDLDGVLLMLRRVLRSNAYDPVDDHAIVRAAVAELERIRGDL